MSKIIYLAAGLSFHPKYDIIYQDLIIKRDLGGDMMNVDLVPFSIVIASPPCNYYSRCNYRRNESNYAINTKHLLPDIIKKCIESKKLFLVENVRNQPLFLKEGLYNFKCFIVEIGRHTYWTNVDLGYTKTIPQRQDFKNGGFVIKYDDMENSYHQGGYNVHQVVERFLENCEKIDKTVDRNYYYLIQ